ncbi:hypothetical protein LCGC14_2247310 [marine sediment metagenome]|uniref:Uncharacterized protein n=1 Tax=marine sediment metagenome TaxID=412755 RepID=A0A0F9FG97_9ZZZZ
MIYLYSDPQKCIHHFRCPKCKFKDWEEMTGEEVEIIRLKQGSGAV